MVRGRISRVVLASAETEAAPGEVLLVVVVAVAEEAVEVEGETRERRQALSFLFWCVYALMACVFYC